MSKTCAFCAFCGYFSELAAKGTKITKGMLLGHDIGYPVEFVATERFHISIK